MPVGSAGENGHAAVREAGIAARRRDFGLTGGSREVKGVKGLPWRQPQDAPERGAFKGGKKCHKVTCKFMPPVWL